MSALIAEVYITPKGDDITIALLNPNSRIQHGLLGGKIVGIDDVKVKWSTFGGRVTAIGNRTVYFGLFGKIKYITGDDERIRILIRKRGHAARSDRTQG